MKTTQIAFALGVVLTAGTIWFFQPRPEPPTPLSMTRACIGTVAGNHCAPFVGCIAGSRTLFDGRADGFLKGSIVGELSNGIYCEGSWKAISPRMGEGAATCEDGSQFSGRYLFRNAKEGYVVASGKTGTGQTFFAVSSGLAYRTGRVRPASNERLHEICTGLLGDG
ncbi:MAG: hypothetical protein GY947_04035 [Rhodobacteraceae bacterium]|nr:hypothetical protein [Paracoccaceae bacterium]